MGIKTKLILGLVIGNREGGVSQPTTISGKVDYATFGIYPIRKVRALDLVTNEVADYSTRYATSSEEFIGRGDKSFRLVGKSLFVLESSQVYEDLSLAKYQYMVKTHIPKSKKQTVYCLGNIICPIFHKDTGLTNINNTTITYYILDVLKISVDLHTYSISMEEIDNLDTSKIKRNLFASVILYPAQIKVLFNKDNMLYKLGSMYTIEDGIRLNDLVLPSDCTSVCAFGGNTVIDRIVFPESIRKIFLADIGMRIKSVVVSRKMSRVALNWLLLSLVARLDYKIVKEASKAINTLDNEKIQQFVDSHKNIIDKRLQDVEVVVY